MNAEPCPDGSDRPSFEAALAQIEAIVHELEEGEVGLAEALARYEHGVRLLKECYALLEHAERRIELLAGIDVAGQPLVRPLDDTEIALEEKAQARGPRRVRPAAGSRSRRPAATDVDETSELF